MFDDRNYVINACSFQLNINKFITWFAETMEIAFCFTIESIVWISITTTPNECRTFSNRMIETPFVKKIFT